MKNVACFCAVMLMIFAAFPLAGQGRIMVSISGNVMAPADVNYKNVYGGTAIFPELKLSLKVVNDLYIWAGYGLVSKSGETVELGLEATSTQNYFSLGGGYNAVLSGNLELFLDLGAVFVSYSEETMGEKISDNAVGFRIGGSLLYTLGGGLLGGVNIGYMYATDTIYGLKIKIGGFKGGLTLAIRL